MKKFKLLFCVVCVCILLVGCGNKKEKNEDKPKDVAQIEKTIKNLYTDENKLVYDNNGIYKLVFYYEGDEITGLEHYYEYKNENEAKAQYEKDKETYKNNTTIKKVSTSGKYVIYIMAGNQYEGKKVEEIKDSYSFLIPVYEK